MLKYISKTVWVLSMVSLFTDTASEMLYPIMPIYLKTIGFSVAMIGFLEGIAEATAGLSKGYFGKLSDNSGKRVPFVRFGYSLSALSKPMMAAFVFPLWIFMSRTLDRIGKGVRTGARDALLSEEATPNTKGRIFGLHRAMDTLGAVLGPSLALLYLFFYKEDYKTLFYLAFVPGILAILATFYLKEKRTTKQKPLKKTTFFSFIRYWKDAPVNYRHVVTGLLLFALFNSSDIFLILKAKEVGLDDSMVIGIYIFYNLVYALFAFPVGILADKIGLRTMYLIGLCLFAVVYFGMALSSNTFFIIGFFALYGIYAAATEGISKAWISNITPKKDLATAIGTYTAFQSICALLASTVAGLIWYGLGSSITFIVSGFVTLLVVLYFRFGVKPNELVA